MRPFSAMTAPFICFTGGARTSYQPSSPGRFTKENTQKNFNNLYGTKGRWWLSLRVHRVHGDCAGRRGIEVGPGGTGFRPQCEMNVGSWDG